jgi:hypothetical protein
MFTKGTRRLVRLAVLAVLGACVSWSDGIECYDYHSCEICEGVACVCYSCTDGVSSWSASEGCDVAAPECSDE